MNNSTLGYSFINASSEGKAESVDPNSVLNKLKSTNPTSGSSMPASAPAPRASPPPLPKSTNNKITAFQDDEDDSPPIQNTLPNSLMRTVEGFNNYDMNDSAVAPGDNNMLYDFSQHMNQPISVKNIPSDDSTQEKINYIIHMLEQNRQLRTENITEEMVMYFFLGFFVLYVSENFVKMGRYTR